MVEHIHPERRPPGSQEAVEAGCSCPQIDNHHGKGYREEEEGVYALDPQCSIHRRLCVKPVDKEALLARIEAQMARAKLARDTEKANRAT